MSVYKIGGILYYHNKSGQLHREEGPAIISKTKCEWYINGQNHRIGGPSKRYINGSCDYLYEWKQYGKYHNEYAPAVIMSDFYDLANLYEEKRPHIYHNNELHMWYVNDINISDDVKKFMETDKLNWDHELWTQKERAFFKLRFL